MDLNKKTKLSEEEMQEAYERDKKDPNITPLKLALTYPKQIMNDPEIKAIYSSQGVKTVLKAGKDELKKTLWDNKKEEDKSIEEKKFWDKQNN